MPDLFQLMRELDDDGAGFEIDSPNDFNRALTNAVIGGRLVVYDVWWEGRKPDGSPKRKLCDTYVEKWRAELRKYHASAPVPCVAILRGRRRRGEMDADGEPQGSGVEWNRIFPLEFADGGWRAYGGPLLGWFKTVLLPREDGD